MIELIFLVIQLFRILELACPTPSDFLFIAWKKKNRFPYYPNPNKFLSLNELITDLAELNKQKWGGYYLWSCKRAYIGHEFIP